MGLSGSSGGTWPSGPMAHELTSPDVSSIAQTESRRARDTKGPPPPNVIEVDRNDIQSWWSG